MDKDDNNGVSEIHCLTLIGQIEGHVMLQPQNKTTKYEHVIPQLVGIRQNNKIKGLLVVLNTVGGDVESGLALAEMLISLGKPVVSIVVGGGHSIGVALAVASDYSFITQSGTMTLHPVRMNGTVIGVQQTFEYFDKMQDRIIDFVTRNSKINRQRLKELILDTGNIAKDVGTVVMGEEAVAEGIIDEVGGLDKALNKLEEMIKERESVNQDTRISEKNEKLDKLVKTEKKKDREKKKEK